MKKLIPSIAYMLIATISFTQTPQGTNYQAVLRNAASAIMPNQNVCVQSTITDTLGTAIYYKETFNVTTNQFGLFTLQIGMGTPVIGTFSAINWSGITPYQKIEVDINCIGSYVTMGSSQLLSVPYALSAENGTTGQDIHEVYGTGQLLVSFPTAFTLIPGLTQSVNIPSNSKVYVTTNGGYRLQIGDSTSYADFNIAIFVDGTASPLAGQRRMVVSNTPNIGYNTGEWSFGRTYTLAPGNHTFEIKVECGDPNSSLVALSSNTIPSLQGVLTLMILKTQ